MTRSPAAMRYCASCSDTKSGTSRICGSRQRTSNFMPSRRLPRPSCQRPDPVHSAGFEPTTTQIYGLVALPTEPRVHDARCVLVDSNHDPLYDASTFERSTTEL